MSEPQYTCSNCKTWQKPYTGECFKCKDAHKDMPSCGEFDYYGDCKECAHWNEPIGGYGFFCHVKHESRQPDELGCSRFDNHKECGTCGWVWRKTGECKDPRIVQRLGLIKDRTPGDAIVTTDTRACAHYASVEQVQRMQEERVHNMTQQINEAREHLRHMPFITDGFLVSIKEQPEATDQ